MSIYVGVKLENRLSVHKIQNWYHVVLVILSKAWILMRTRMVLGSNSILDDLVTVP